MNSTTILRSVFRFRLRSIVIVAVIVVLVLIGGAFLIGSSEAYSEATLFARKDPMITSQLGPVYDVSPRVFDGFALNDSMDGGSADFAFTVKGRDHQGNVSLHLSSKAGRWKVGYGTLRINNGAVIDLKP
jgi:hypothetical protein